jgi:hypothetical protein
VFRVITRLTILDVYCGGAATATTSIKFPKRNFRDWEARAGATAKISKSKLYGLISAGYISLSDYRPLREIYCYPVFLALHSHLNTHENRNILININLHYCPTGGSACVQMRLNPSFPIPHIFNWGLG